MFILELIAVAVLLVTIVTIGWTAFRVGISPMPSSEKAREQILQATENAGDGPIIDLGSGWGTLVIPLARKFPERQIIGYELSLVPWLISRLRGYALNLQNLSLDRQDFLQADLSGAAVLVCYLHPDGMTALQEKLQQEAADEMLIISNTFALPDVTPTKVIQLGDLYRTKIYMYQQKLSSLK